MKKTALIVLLVSISISVFTQPMDGNYTIGKNDNDFMSINEAINALETNGISAPIYFFIENGTYEEQIIIPEIAGTSTDNTICFQSESGNKTDVIIEYASTQSDATYTLKLDSTKNIQFKNLTLKTKCVLYDNTLVELNNSENISFNKCQLIGSIKESNNFIYTKYLIISKEEVVNAHNLSLENNDFINSNYGIKLEGKSHGNQTKNLAINKNIFKNIIWYPIDVTNYRQSIISNNNFFEEVNSPQNYYPIKLYYSSSVEISYNEISAECSRGITAYYNNNINILNNKIYNANTNCIEYVSGKDLDSSTYSLIANNFLKSNTNGIRIYYSHNLKTYHNSILGGVSLEGVKHNYLLNNCIYNPNNPCVEVSDKNYTILTSNNNNVYSDGNILAKWGGNNCKNLTEWQTLSSQDANSVSKNPDYFSDSDLHTLSMYLDNKGTAVPEVSKDIDGNDRSLTTPDIGATEFTALYDNAALLEVSMPNSCGLTSSEQVTVTIVNRGKSPIIQPIDIYYSTDKGETYNYVSRSSTIPSGDTVSNYIYVDMSTPGKYDCIVYLSYIFDENKNDDTLSGTGFSYGYISNFPFTENFDDSTSCYFQLIHNISSSVEIDESSGKDSEYGLKFSRSNIISSPWQGGDNPDSTQIWVDNEKFHAFAKSCMIDTRSLTNPALQFDMKIIVDTYSSRAWFRLLIDDIIVPVDIDGKNVYTSKKTTPYETKTFLLKNLPPIMGNLSFQSCIFGIPEIYIDNIKIGEMPVINLEDTIKICEGDTAILDAGAGNGYTYAWFKADLPDTLSKNQTLNVQEEGKYFVHVFSDIGIKATDSVTIIVNPKYLIIDKHNICKGDSVLWREKYYKTSGVYYDSLQTKAVCDSIYKLELTINQTYHFIENQTICDNINFIWHAKHYDKPGVYFDSLLTITGCDSVYELHLQINDTYLFTEQESICDNDSILWRGQFYKNQGTFYDSLITMSGCDSIYKLELTLLPTYLFEDTVNICQGESFVWRENSYSNEGVYFDSLLTKAGCDSIYKLSLQHNPTYFFSESKTICDNENYLWHNKYYNSTGKYYDSLKTKAGCDSIYELDLQAHNTYIFTEKIEICENDSVLWRNFYYKNAGTYYDNYLSTKGCDSIYELVLNVNLQYHFIDELHYYIHDSVLWRGKYYKSENTYFDSLKTINSCDSIYELRLSEATQYIISETHYVCEGAAYYWRNNYYNIEGTYYDSLKTKLGADSIFELKLCNHPTYHFTEDITVCEGTPFFWQGNNYSESGNYTKSFISSQGCDSIYELNLTIQPTKYSDKYLYFCEGDSVLWKDKYYKFEGLYYDTLLSASGCDSIILLMVYRLSPPVPKSIYGLYAINVNDNAEFIITDYQPYETYHWFAKSPSEFNANYEKLEASWTKQGEYYVAVVAEDENGCLSDSSYFYFVVEAQNSIIFNNSKSIKIYPNPVSKELTIEYTPNLIVEIIDVFGNLLIKSNEKIIDVTELPCGIYLLYIKDEDNQPIRIEKLIKK